MAKVVRRHWITEAEPGVARRDRRSCDYEAYVPDLLAGRKLLFEGSTAADIADAERAIAVMDTGASALVDTEALARILLRAECVAPHASKDWRSAHADSSEQRRPTISARSQPMSQLPRFSGTSMRCQLRSATLSRKIQSPSKQCFTSTDGSSAEPGWRPTQAIYVPSRTGLAAATTIPVQLYSFLRHPNMCVACSKTFANSVMTTSFLRSRRRQWRMHSSKRFIRLSMAMAGQAAP